MRWCERCQWGHTKEHLVHC
uniref:Uncharacterized protein n=1 Tax=Arundo donax TaxID=35708 RepID=A0A0A9G368_ARUDO